jgi:hypothetical protein
LGKKGHGNLDNKIRRQLLHVEGGKAVILGQRKKLIIGRGTWEHRRNLEYWRGESTETSSLGVIKAVCRFNR